VLILIVIRRKVGIAVLIALLGAATPPTVAALNGGTLPSSKGQEEDSGPQSPSEHTERQLPLLPLYYFRGHFQTVKSGVN
ncbi:MAG TPA: hypothetical protein VFQ36_12660, partial [Ktedonobacteraceae bacterium]|nr:hypothetical protein [Ktedonobacteraceae bacterium]